MFFKPLFYIIGFGLMIHTANHSRTGFVMSEICDNGIDDDMDGLIDINDDDCLCDPIVPSGLIPNPSFEDRSCCPMERARLDCADSWTQASAATTDYVHTCGFLGNVIDMPLPVPDGEGAIGLRDGSFNDGNFKEYAGACLSSPIEAGKSYRLRLDVGFRTAVTSPGFRLSIFGHPDCSNLPFGNGNASIGCPSNSPGWVLLGEVPVSGIDEWIEAEINFQPNQNIGAVAIGADCSIRGTGVDRYYFFDNLRLAETVDFGYQVNIETGNPCLPTLNLGLSDMQAGERYQWYRNGIAIPGATSPNYAVADDLNREAEYRVRIEDDQGCQLTDVFPVVIPQNNYSVTDMACANSTYSFGSQNITSSGMYTELFLDVNGCDSTVNLDLTFRTLPITIIDTIICSGQVLMIGNEVISSSGNYQRILPDLFGCDSTINLTLEVRDPLVSFDFQSQTVSLGESVPYDLQGQQGNLQSFIWRSDQGMICGDCPSGSFLPFENTTVLIDITDNNNCPIRDSFEVFVNKDYRLFIPNAFSPNTDGSNDLFTIYPTQALAAVKSMLIFDRWGSLVYEALETFDLQWDGTHKNVQLNVGTYVYVLEVIFIDGHEKTISGTVHLIR